MTKSKTHNKKNKIKKNKTLKLNNTTGIPSAYKNITGSIDINAFKHNINYFFAFVCRDFAAVRHVWRSNGSKSRKEEEKAEV